VVERMVGLRVGRPENPQESAAPIYKIVYRGKRPIGGCNTVTLTLSNQVAYGGQCVTRTRDLLLVRQAL
jgi:hypothetical protein